MYGGVPATNPSRSGAAVPRCACATSARSDRRTAPVRSPGSSARRSTVRMTFSGFRSRWTTWRSCAPSSARASSKPVSTTRAGASGPLRHFDAERVAVEILRRDVEMVDRILRARRRWRCRDARARPRRALRARGVRAARSSRAKSGASDLSATRRSAACRALRRRRPCRRGRAAARCGTARASFPARASAPRAAARGRALRGSRRRSRRLPAPPALRP